MSEQELPENEAEATPTDTAEPEAHDGADAVAPSEDAAVEAEQDDEEAGADAINALKKLPASLLGRLCRGVPMRTFLAELARIDRSVYFRYFKGYRPVKITSKRLQEVVSREVFDRNNGLLAQLVIYNWDEFQWKLYGDLQKHVKGINEDVEAIEHISAEEADPIFDDLLERYDPRDVAIVALINGLRVDDDYLKARFPTLL